MRRRRIVIVSAVCVLAGIGVLALWPGEKEPEYNGKSLSEWLLYRPRAFAASNALELQTEAIRQIGEPAVPWLLKWARYKSPPWRRNLLGFAPPSWRTTIEHIIGEERRIQCSRAVWFGFKVLGPKAADAVPALTAVVNNPREPFDYPKALNALAHMGERGFPPVLAVLENVTHPGRATAAGIIGDTVEWGTNRLRAVPTLVSYLDSDDYFLAALAESALGKIAADPVLPLPDLARSLSKPGSQGNPDRTIGSLQRMLVSQKSPERLRIAATMALGLMGKRAHDAIPALVRTLNDDDELVQSAATNALKNIAPEVLTNRMKDF